MGRGDFDDAGATPGDLLLIYQGIRFLLWFQGTVFFFSFFVRAFCMGLLNSIHDEIGNRSFACWFCLDISPEIAVRSNRSKGMYKGNRRKEVCRLFGRQKHKARYRNYRQVLNLRLRCRRKTKNRLPQKNYRRI